MENVLRDRGILDVIRSLSDQAASGRLQISTGMTDGVLFFNNGKLVDARVGKLTGFQAINALASVPDASYNFDPATHPPAQTSITSKERVLLKDFFGIEAADPAPVREAHDVDASSPADDDEATLVRPKPAFEPRPYPDRAEIPPIPQPVEPIRRSTLRPALLVVLLTVIGVAAVAFLYLVRKPDSTASVAAPVQNSSPAEAPQTAAVADTAAAVPDLTGNWNVVNTVERTSYGAYRNMQIGFNVSINQTGKEFTGSGEKIFENGQSLPADSRTPIVVKGTIDGDKVEATFSESGARRKTDGRFVWRIDKTSGGLTGTFVSTAARSSGKSAATKGF